MRRLFLLLALLTCSQFALADTTYVYTGNPYSSAASPYTTSDAVTGSFTLADPLAANLDDASINPEAFSFSDGVDTFSNVLFHDGYNGDNYSSPSYSVEDFTVSTDASGDIDAWDVELAFALPSHAIQFVVKTVNNDSSQSDQGYLDYQTYATGINFDAPGAWSVESTTPPPQPTPEPGSLVLLSTGMLGMAWSVRRRFARPLAG